MQATIAHLVHISNIFVHQVTTAPAILDYQHNVQLELTIRYQVLQDQVVALIVQLATIAYQDLDIRIRVLRVLCVHPVPHLPLWQALRHAQQELMLAMTRFSILRLIANLAGQATTA